MPCKVNQYEQYIFSCKTGHYVKRSSTDNAATGGGSSDGLGIVLLGLGLVLCANVSKVDHFPTMVRYPHPRGIR